MSTRAITAGPGTSVSAALPAGSGDREPILVVERNPAFGRALVDQLAADGHPTECARTANEARMLAAARPPRLLLLGELDGPRATIALLESIRAGDPKGCRRATLSPWPRGLPVIVLSPRTALPDLLRAFDAGADDFLPRNAGYLELRARLRALLRRSESKPEDEPLQIGPLRIDPAAHAASLHGERLELRRLEYELLLHLASNPSRVFRRQELLRAVWGFRCDGTTRTVDSHASRLRRKLSATGEHWIVSVRSVGYRLV